MFHRESEHLQIQPLISNPALIPIHFEVDVVGIPFKLTVKSHFFNNTLHSENQLTIHCYEKVSRVVISWRLHMTFLMFLPHQNLLLSNSY